MTVGPGSRLGDFDLLEEVGRGGTGVVYRAVQRSLGREVAVKVLPDLLSQDSGISARFQGEALRMAQLSHPNIAQVYTVGEAGGIRYFAMQYLRGGTLQHRLQRGPMSVNAAVEAAAQVADALHCAHQAGTIHRDVKPANILFDDQGRPVVTDFGIAKAVDGSRLTATGASLGTPHYMAPEQLKGSPVDARADVYALGAVLYEMVCGRPPFEADTPISVAMKHLSEQALPARAFCPGLPERTERIISIALAKDPAQRFGSAAEMAIALRSSAIAPPPLGAMDKSRVMTCYVPAYQDRVVDLPPRTGGRSATLIVALLTVLLVLAGVAVLIVALRPREVPSGRPARDRPNVAPVGKPAPALPGSADLAPPARERDDTPVSDGLPPAPGVDGPPAAPVGSATSLGAAARQVIVPSVVGLSQAEAERGLRQARLVGAVADYEPSHRIPTGSVVSQEPAGGTSAESGAMVSLTISEGLRQDSQTQDEQRISRMLVGRWRLRATSGDFEPGTFTLTEDLRYVLKEDAGHREEGVWEVEIDKDATLLHVRSGDEQMSYYLGVGARDLRLDRGAATEEDPHVWSEWTRE
ncbi:MAG: protein kinase [Armatimonadetes bacterium]|nr:protein kinase [Armatimonadota bacterium]